MAEIRLSESVENAIIDLVNKVRFGDRTNPADREPLRRAVAAALLRARADGIEDGWAGEDHLTLADLRAQAAALEAKP